MSFYKIIHKLVKRVRIVTKHVIDPKDVDFVYTLFESIFNWHVIKTTPSSNSEKQFLPKFPY